MKFRVGIFVDLNSLLYTRTYQLIYSPKIVPTINVTSGLDPHGFMFVYRGINGIASSMLD